MENQDSKIGNTLQAHCSIALAVSPKEKSLACFDYTLLFQIVMTFVLDSIVIADCVRKHTSAIPVD